jgi:hypothetical protein
MEWAALTNEIVGAALRLDGSTATIAPCAERAFACVELLRMTVTAASGRAG